jgi:hypothetical protein
MSFLPLRVPASLRKERVIPTKALAATAALILCVGLDAQAQAPVISPSDLIGMDYPEAWFTDYAVNRFEVQYDAEGWTSLGIPPVYGSADGVTTYVVNPLMRTGGHTVSFRACNAEVCSSSSSPFAYVVPGDGPTYEAPTYEAPTGDVRVVQLQAGHTGNSCLDVSGASTENGAALIQWQCHGDDNQVWSIEPASDGYSRVVSRRSGKCLDVSDESTRDGASVLQWQCHGGANQQWRVEPNGDGYRLVARHSGKCLDVPGWATDDGTSLTQWQCTGGANQTWLARDR